MESSSNSLLSSLLTFTFLKYVLLAAGSSYVAWTLYCAWFGPLARVPGPALARYSSLWRILNAASSHAPLNFQQLHKRYGKVVRIGPNHVSVSDPDQIPVIYGISSKFTKSRFYDTLTPLFNGKFFYSIFTIQNQDAHRKLKSGVAQKYSLSSLLALEPLVDKVTENLVSKLQPYCSTSKEAAGSEDRILNLGEWLQFYAFDVIGAITFSKSFGFIDEGRDSRGIIEGIEVGLGYGSVVGQVPQIHPYLLGSPLLQNITNSIPAIAKGNPIPGVFRMIDEALSSPATMKTTKNCEDFNTYLRKQNEKDPSRMTEETMINHMFVNLLAGSDTTAISLRTIFYLLMKNPRTYSKLRKEIDDADAAGLLSPVVTYSEAQAHIPYLALVVKEALRCHPAVALTLERIVPKDGTQIDDKYIPEGTTIGVNAWVVHYDENVFGEDVGEFRPERWLEGKNDAEKEKLKKMERSFFAFGHGARSCIGKNISLMEMGKFVPQFLREFDVEWAGGDEWTVKSTWFAKQTNVLVRLKKRMRK